MIKIKVKINKSVFNKFPRLRFGIIQINDVKKNISNKYIINELKYIIKNIKIHNTSIEESKVNYVKLWKEVYIANNIKPRIIHTKFEKIIKNILDGKDITTKNTIVDLANFFSLKEMIPITVYSKITKNITISIDKDKLIFKSNKQKINPRINNKSKEYTIIIETMYPYSKLRLKKTIKELSNLIKTTTLAKISSEILDMNSIK